MVREAWRATVHGATESAWLNNWTLIRKLARKKKKFNSYEIQIRLNSAPCHLCLPRVPWTVQQFLPLLLRETISNGNSGTFSSPVPSTSICKSPFRIPTLFKLFLAPCPMEMPQSKNSMLWLSFIKNILWFLPLKEEKNHKNPSLWSPSTGSFFSYLSSSLNYNYM